MISRLPDFLKRPLDTVLGFFYPEVCELCRMSRAGPVDGYVCTGCQSRARFVRPPFCKQCGRPFEGDITTAFECDNCQNEKLYFSEARSAVIFDGPVQEALHRYKYKRALWVEPFLAKLMVAAIDGEVRSEDWDLIVPVPLHRARQNEREFNQAEYLAKHLARHSGIPMNARLLKRVENTSSQTRLSREERHANVRNAFQMRTENVPAGKRILVFDDVMTTGATTNACAKVLMNAGASRVGVWTLARGI